MLIFEHGAYFRNFTVKIHVSTSTTKVELSLGLRYSKQQGIGGTTKERNHIFRKETELERKGIFERNVQKERIAPFSFLFAKFIKKNWQWKCKNFAWKLKSQLSLHQKLSQIINTPYVSSNIFLNAMILFLVPLKIWKGTEKERKKERPFLLKNKNEIPF